MAAVIPFTTIEGVIAALAKIDVMHKHMAASPEGKVCRASQNPVLDGAPAARVSPPLLQYPNSLKCLNPS